MANEPIQLSPKVLDLVSADRHARRPVGRLSERHLRELTAIAERRGELQDVALSHKALQAIAVGAPARVSTPLLGRVLSDAHAPRSDRVTAARLLATVGGSPARQVLSGAVEADNPRVRQAVYAALGEIGEPADLDVLRRCAEPSDPHAARQLRFAIALIAHRHGLVGPMLDGGPSRDHEPGPADEMIELSLRSKAQRTVERDAARWKGSRYGIDVGKLGFELRAGRAEWTVFVNGTLGKTASTLSPIFERPFIAAILGRWNAEHLALNTQYVALTHPSDEGAVIVVARGDGEIMYTGTAAKLADEITYTVSDVERPGTAPTTVAGTVGRRSLDVKVAVPFGTRVGTRMTSDVRPV